MEGGFEGGTVSPAFGGGGIEDPAVAEAEAEAEAVGSATAPGWGGGGDCAELGVAVVVVGVAVRGVVAALPVGAGRLGAAPGWAVA